MNIGNFKLIYTFIQHGFFATNIFLNYNQYSRKGDSSLKSHIKGYSQRQYSSGPRKSTFVYLWLKNFLYTESEMAKQYATHCRFKQFYLCHVKNYFNFKGILIKHQENTVIINCNNTINKLSIFIPTLTELEKCE